MTHDDDMQADTQTGQFAYDFQPPHDLEAEKCVLGSMMLSTLEDLCTFDLTAAGLRTESFYLADHGIIFDALMMMRKAGEKIDLVTLANRLKAQNLYDEIGGPATLVTIANKLPSYAHGPTYAAIVKEKSMLREILRVSNDAVRYVHKATKHDRAEQICRDFIDDLSSIACTGDADKIHHLSEVVADVLSAQDAGGNVHRYPTGLSVLDDVIGGMARGRFTQVGGRPAMGKSLAVKQIILNIARTGVPCGIVSVEETREKIGQNYLSNASGVENNHIAYNRISHEEADELIPAAAELSALPIFICDSAMKLSEVESAITTLVMKHHCQVVAVDYLQLVSLDRECDNENRELTHISRGLKGIFKRLNVAGIVPVQLNRGNESNGIRKPALRDLRGSGCLASDSKVWMGDGRMVPIGSLVGQSNFPVHTLNLETLKIETSIASRAFSTGRKHVFKLKTQLGRQLIATANHPLYTLDGWKPLEDLKPGDRVALPRNLPFSGSEEASISIAHASLLGLLIGDGCTLPDHVIQYTTNEMELAELSVELAKAAFPGGTRPRINKERNWLQVYFPSVARHTHGVRNPISEWLGSMDIFGLRSYEKLVPDLMFSQPNIVVAAFLKHLWATDGCIGKLTAYYATSSFILGQGVQTLLLRFGINARIVSVSQGTKGRTQYHVVISGGADLISFSESVGVAGRRKSLLLNSIAEKSRSVKLNTNRDVIPSSAWRTTVRAEMKTAGLSLREFHRRQGTQHGSEHYRCGISRERMASAAVVTESKNLKCLSESDVYWDKIASIEKNGSEEVFDITVPGRANFIADGVVVHNSIEQDGDCIMLLHREDYYHKGEPAYVQNHQIEVIVAKNKDGPTGIVPLHFDPRTQRISNWVGPTGSQDDTDGMF